MAENDENKTGAPEEDALEQEQAQEASEGDAPEEPEWWGSDDEATSDGDEPAADEDTDDANDDEDEPDDAGDAEADEAEGDDATEDEPEEAKPADRPRPKRSVRRREERAASSATAPKAKAHPARGGIASVPFQAWIAIAAACLVVGLLVGRFVLGGVSAAGKTSISESELDGVVATVTYEGKSYDVTAREAIEAASTLDSVRNEDGTYRMPSAEGAVAAARNKVLEAEVAKAGITVTEDDATAYAEEYLGTSDYATIAEQYGMDEESVRRIVEESAGVRKLYDQVVTDSDLTAPTAPEQPAEGQEDTPNATYGAYVVGLLGDEWDAEAGTWARTDGPFYASLGSETFSADSATYNQANTAYYVAYQQYVQDYSEISSKWTDFYNGCMANATIELTTLTA